MARFLAYHTTLHILEDVCVDDISAIVADEGCGPGDWSRIYLRSDPKQELSAKGTPHDVLMGNIIER